MKAGVMFISDLSTENLEGCDEVIHVFQSSM